MTSLGLSDRASQLLTITFFGHNNVGYNLHEIAWDCEALLHH